MIGKMEEAFVYRDSAVCADCYQRLRRPQVRSSKKSWGSTMLIAAVVGLLAVICTVAVIKLMGTGKKPSSVANAGEPKPSLPADIRNAPPVVMTPRPLSDPVDVSVIEPKPNPKPREEEPPSYTQGNLAKELARMKADIDKTFPTIPADKLVGRKFVIARNSAYEERPNEAFLSIGDFNDHPIYSAVVGKLCTLVKLNPRKIGDPAIIQVDGTRKQYSLMVPDAPFVPEEIILLSEIDNARAKWKGKELWYRGDTLMVDEKPRERDIAHVKVKPYTRLIVVDVRASGEASSPVEFVLQTPRGEQGYVDVTLSGTTVPLILRDGYFSFVKQFFESDPHVLFPHSPEIWRQIESKTVSIGMNPEQVMLSWHEPRDVKTTVTAEGQMAQWIYGHDRYVYLTNGLVTRIQN
jgi:hypothetical protein